VQTPVKKQAFAFDDGQCLDDPAVALPIFRTRLTADGDVQVSP
jgi:nitrite reductase (NADH) small subunit